jgi:hypothetical protein
VRLDDPRLMWIMSDGVFRALCLMVQYQNAGRVADVFERYLA